MKRFFLFLLLLLPSYLFAQSDSLVVLEKDNTVVEFLDEPPVPLTWKDRREPLLAGFLSYIMPGLGQVYNKQYEKALGIVAIMTFSSISSVQYMEKGHAETGGIIAGVGMLGTWLYSLVDAVSTANQINRTIERQLGLNASLSLKPDFQLNRPFLLSKPEPLLGLKLSVSL